MLRRDQRGLEGLPLKLLITSLVIALTAPALYGSVSYLEFSTGLSASLDEAEEIREAALSAFVGGPGNIRTVDVSLGARGQEGQIVVGGGEADPRSALIEVLWRGGAAATLRLEDPTVLIVTEDGAPLVLEGDAALRLECVEGEGRPVVMAELV